MPIIKERLATLEQGKSDTEKWQGDTETTINMMAQDLKYIKQTLDELTGAKKALMWITGTAATAIGLFIAWLNSHRG